MKPAESHTHTMSWLNFFRRPTAKPLSFTVIADDAGAEPTDSTTASTSAGPAPVVMRLHISNVGEIVVDHRLVQLPELESLLSELSAKSGEVWYTREAPDDEPAHATTEVIQQVLDAVIARKLPVRLRETR